MNPEHQTNDQSAVIRRVVTIGATMVGLGIIILIAQNWAVFPALFKVLLLLVLMVSAYSIGYILMRYPTLETVGKGVIFLGALIFGANIFLIAQIYNIQVNWPDGFMIWMFGAFLTLYAVPMPSLRVLAIILAFLGLGGFAFGFMEILVGTSVFYASSFIVLLSTITLFAAASVYKNQRMEAQVIDFY